MLPSVSALRRVILSLGFLLALLLANAQLIRAQQDQTPKRGFHPGGSYAVSDIETINTTNGNVILSVPLVSLPAGRGTAPGSTLRLLYNSKLFDSRVERHMDLPEGEGDCISPSGDPIPCDEARLNGGSGSKFVNAGYSPVSPQNAVYTMNTLQASNAGGWTYGFSYKLNLENRFDQYAEAYVPPCNSDEYRYHWKLKMTFPDGSEHEFRPVNSSLSVTLHDGYYNVDPNGLASTGDNCQNSWASTTGMMYYSTDGTYMRLRVEHDGDGDWWNNAWTLFLPDGSRITGGNAPQRIYDRNNNYIEIQGVTLANGHSATKVVDQVGRYFLIEYDAAPAEDHVVMYGAGGQEIRWRIKYKTIWAYRKYRATQDVNLPNGVSQQRDFFTSFKVVDQIILPAQAGNLHYTFTYNGSTTEPSVGSYTTGWGELSSVTLPSGAQSSYQYLLDSQQSTASLWGEVLQNHVTRKDLAYQKEDEDDTSVSTETWIYAQTSTASSITNPDGGTSWEFFRDTQDPAFWDSGLVYQSVRPDGTVVERIWKENVSHSASNPYVKTEFTTIKNAAGNFVKTAIKDYNYDKNGNVTAVKEYDWIPYGDVPRPGGVPAVPNGLAPKRVTTNSYNSVTPDASDSTTVNGNTYIYNSSPNLKNSLAASEVGNGAQTLSRSEFSYDSATTTGNLTQQKSWDSTKGGYSDPLGAGNSVTVSHQYDSYGNRLLSTDARGVQTQFVYNAVGGFTGLYPTETKSAFGTSVQRISTLQYDFNTGLVTRVTDVDNNVSASTVYDAFGRPTLPI